MNLKPLLLKVTMFCFIAGLLMNVPAARGQSLKFRIPMTVTDSGKVIRSGKVKIGLHPNATTCIDTALLTGFVDRWAETDSNSEHELEGPPPPPGFDIRFSYPTAVCAISPWNIDIHKSVSSTQIDTFRIKIQLDATQGDDLHSVMFRWPKVLSQYADSLILFRNVGTVRFRVDMALQDTFNLPWSLSANGVTMSSVFVILKNPKTPPGAPIVITTAPADDATSVSVTPTFQWTAVTQAYYYRFQLATSPLFSGGTVLRTDSLAGSATSLIQSSSLNQTTDYYWRILVSNPYGVSYYQAPPLHFTTGIAGAVDPGRDGIPSSFGLGQNYPNPFNPTTEIKYQLSERSHVVLKVFDALGREVRTLVDGTEEPGYKSVQFDARNLPSGEYTYRLIAGAFVESHKMMLLK